VGESLLHVLRERLGLAGAKNACEQGECGSCSVLIDGVLVCACLELAAAATGCDITTVEGLDGDPLTDVQEAFVTEGGVQCGFCTPGLAVTGAAVLADGVHDPEEQRRLMSGNLCRCTGYTKVLEALQAAGEER
jgi:carbon-monoxide dehydrogenase small subunit